MQLYLFQNFSSFFLMFSFLHLSFTKNLHIKGPPILLSDRNSQKKNVNEGNDVKLNCPVGGNPEPIVEWSKGGEEIPLENWGRYKISKTSLRIKGAVPQDQGAYLCKAINGFGTVQFSFYLVVLPGHGNVLNSPRAENLRMDQVLPISGSNIRKITGQNVLFKCIATGDPQPEITWLRDGSVIEPTVIDDKQNELFEVPTAITETPNKLLLAHLKSSDSGNYTCLASNIYGVVSANWTLNVIEKSIYGEPVSNTLEMSNVTSHAGEDATFSCKGSWDTDLAPKVMWLRQIDIKEVNTIPSNQTFAYKGNHYLVLQPTELVLLEGKKFSTKLMIFNVHPKDGGVYVCTVSSRFGVNVQSAHLTVIETEIEKRPILLISGLAMGVVVLIVVIVAASVCRKKRTKPSPPPSFTGRSLILPTGTQDNQFKYLQPMPFSHTSRLAMHGGPVSSTPLGAFQYPANVVHLTSSQLSQQGSDATGGGATRQDQPSVIVCQDSNLMGSLYMGPSPSAMGPSQKVQYHQFDLV